jgi:hypothetical protein
MLQDTAAWEAEATFSDYSTSIAWGDVDGDGDLDLAMGYYREYHNQLYMNQSGFLALSTQSLSTSSILAFGDVDMDGDLDLTNGSELYQNENGIFTLSSWSPTSGCWFPWDTTTTSLAWGDMNGDGDLDLAVGYDCMGMGEQVVQVFLNNNGTLANAPAWGATYGSNVPIVSSLAWGDLDNDGDLDLAVGDNNFNPNQVYLNISNTLQITPGWTAAAGYSTTSLAWGDVDNDGNLDLAVGNTYGQPVQLYLNVAGQLESIPTWSVAGYDTVAVAWGDVDGDGDLDLAVGNENYHNQLFLNVGGRLQTTPAWEVDGQWTTSLAWGDVDADGDLDLAFGYGVDTH